MKKSKKSIVQIKKYSLGITPIIVEGFSDLGDDMTDEFKNLYHSFFTKGVIQLSESFKDVSKKNFSSFDKKQRIALGDAYFNNLAAITHTLLDRQQYDTSFRLWTEILSFVKEWEDDNKPKELHKGTPYYFSGVSSILQNDFDAALMSMHNALDEDKKNNPKWDEAPGYWFLTLNDQKPNQFFKPFVDGMIGFLRDRLDGNGSEQGKYKDHYQTTRSGKLTYDQFRSKFLDNKNISEEVKYLFVYSIIRIWHLRRLHKSKVGDNLMAPLIFTNALFALLLVLDSLLKSWNNPGHKRWEFSKHLIEAAKHEGWGNSKINQQQYFDELEVNKRRDADFNKWCKELIGKSGMQYKTTKGRVLGPLESDFVLAYGLRNFSAHSIQSQKILWQEYTGILQSILNCVFKTLELL
ncbi:MAG: hypothetical protein Q7S74_03890 [Nanoarchaeota archaeon]|nr:hypothetical protein [Nanoarchaeota archaeon]